MIKEECCLAFPSCVLNLNGMEEWPQRQLQVSELAKVSTIFSHLNQFLRDKEAYIGDLIISRKTSSLPTEWKRKNYLSYLFALFFWLFPTKGQDRPFALVFMTEHDLKLMSGRFLISFSTSRQKPLDFLLLENLNNPVILPSHGLL